jgi:hypothetical protein
VRIKIESIKREHGTNEPGADEVYWLAAAVGYSTMKVADVEVRFPLFQVGVGDIHSLDHDGSVYKFKSGGRVWPEDAPGPASLGTVAWVLALFEADSGKVGKTSMWANAVYASVIAQTGALALQFMNPTHAYDREYIVGRLQKIVRGASENTSLPVLDDDQPIGTPVGFRPAANAKEHSATFKGHGGRYKVKISYSR